MLSLSDCQTFQPLYSAIFLLSWISAEKQKYEEAKNAVVL